MTKKLFIKTWGCQMNLYDSVRMADVLAPLGYSCVETAEDADLVVLNTCHIREKASEKLFSELGRLRALKDARKARGDAMILAVAGCVAQAEGAEILLRAPFVDAVLGPQSYHRLPEIVARAVRGGGGVLETDLAAEEKFDALPEGSSTSGPSAFLTVQEGCDKFCTFCVVPYTRGAEYSRPPADVLGEARSLARRGVREITLLGQNVNAYHAEGVKGIGGTGGDAFGLGDLIRMVAEIEGIERLRYTTSHPRDMDDGLLAAHAEVPELMPFVHLPVQSGSNRVLAAMNRRYSVADYRRAVDRLRAARPDIALSGDFIVGFPGETDADFQDTLDLVRAAGYAQAYSFKYSPRPGTPAWALEDQVPDAVKSVRLQALQDLLSEQQRAFNAAAVGRTMPVLLERRGRHPGQLTGRSPYMQAVNLAADAGRFGDIVDVLIVDALPNSLAGRLTEAPAAVA